MGRGLSTNVEIERLRTIDMLDPGKQDHEEFY